jgi:branched-chain amino acid transport system substrate-binding protein
VAAAKSTDDAKLADIMRKSTFKTVVGDVKFGKGGEWAESRVVQVQFQNVKSGDVAQFRDMNTQVVVTPDAFASGKVIYPYADAKK